MRKIDDLTIAAIRRAYINREGTIAALAERFGVSQGTIKRLKREGNWDVAREAQAQVIKTAVKQPPAKVTIAGVALEFDEMLTTAINSLSADVANLPGRSRESAALAMCKLIESYRRFHPLSIDEAIDLVLALPDFDPQEFARRLRERYLSKQVSR